MAGTAGRRLWRIDENLGRGALIGLNIAIVLAFLALLPYHYAARTRRFVPGAV